MPSSKRSEEMLIRQALIAEADRAPAASDVLAALTDEIARRRTRDQRWAITGAAAAMVTILVLTLTLGGRTAGPSRIAPDHSSQSATPSVTITTAPTTTTTTTTLTTVTQSPPPNSSAAGPLFPARYLPTKLPPGWVANSRQVVEGSDGSGPVASWQPANAGQNPLSALLYISGSPVTATTAAQVGPLRHVDVHGVTGTLRVAKEAAGGNTLLYYDDLWWSPKPGTVLTMSVYNAPTDPSAMLIALARSVAPTSITTPVPFRLPALPPDTSLVSEWVTGTPHGWFLDGVVGPHSGTVLDVSWGPGNLNESGAPNVTVRGVPGYYIGDDNSAYITAKVDGYTLTVEHDGPMSKATLVRIINEMTLYPDVRYPWLTR